MNDPDQSSAKTHYICQTYVEKKSGGANQISLKIDKQIQYSTAAQASERAEREVRLQNCIGADAYMVVEDPNSGEVGAPTFLLRLGSVPEDDDF